MAEPLYDNGYEGPTYQFTTAVKNLSRLPRFGHASDFTVLISPDQNDQADYAAGLIALFVFLFIVFVLWTIAIFVLKIMGPANAGFLSGHHFVVPDPADDEKNAGKRPLRVRVVFLAATAVCMVSAFLFVAKGLTNINDATYTMSRSLQTSAELMNQAEIIAANLGDIGKTAIAIRDDAVRELNDLCPDNPNFDDALGIDIMGTADQAKADLTMLTDFISDGLKTLDKELLTVRGFVDRAEQATASVDMWDWPMKLLVSGLFIFPSFLAMGVGLVMLDVNVRRYQTALTYFFMPLFGATIVAAYTCCCILLPVSAISADACSGSSMGGGPDDTVLTVYRNLQGADAGMIFEFVAYYTQQCRAEYYPFGFISTYLNDLDNAVGSTQDAAGALSNNQALLEVQCGRSFVDVIDIVNRMTVNLKLLQQQADLSLDLVKCENVNSLYVNTVHEAGCTYSVDAMAWIFACLLLISVGGLIMITLRAAYYPVEYLELGESWETKPAATFSASKDSADPTDREADRSAALASVAPTTTPFIDPRLQVSHVNDNNRRADGNIRPAVSTTPVVADSEFVQVTHGDHNEFEISQSAEEF